MSLALGACLRLREVCKREEGWLQERVFKVQDDRGSAPWRGVNSICV